MPRSRARWMLAAAILLAATAAAYGPILGNGFTSYDDNHYVTANPHVQGGLSAAGIRWAFTTTDAANWHPLTWLSHMVDYALYGLGPRGHHATSLALHLANVLLLLLVLQRMTGEAGKSAAVAALFALHPLHVESVAWVAERKDVLSAFFFLLTLGAYTGYARRPSPGRYAAVVAAFAAGLLAKPMLVTTPFVLLLLDRWPLERKESRRRLLIEKLPLVLLSVASALVTIAAQRSGGALGAMQHYPLAARVANAALSYILYLRKTVWPFDLAAFYPYPDMAAAWPAAVLTGIALVVATAGIVRSRRPYLLVGWLWYVGMLVPVIGLIQVGEQSLADRYTYLPLIGVFVMAAWGVPDALAARWAGRAAFGALLALFAITTWRQTRVWHDSVTLFEHALAVTRESAPAHVSLAIALEERGDPAGAERHLRRAVALRPDDPVAHNNLGEVLAKSGRTTEAETHYRAALAADAGSADAHNNLGIALARQGELEEALSHFDAAVRRQPGNARYRFNWGTALVSGRRWSEAVDQLREAVRLDPGYAAAHFNLSAALFYAGDLEGARAEADIARRYGYEPPSEFLEMLPR